MVHKAPAMRIEVLHLRKSPPSISPARIRVPGLYQAQVVPEASVNFNRPGKGKERDQFLRLWGRENDQDRLLLYQHPTFALIVASS